MQRLILSMFIWAALGAGAVSADPTPAPGPLVHIKNFMFVPAKLTVAAGTTVRFINDDDEPHTVTSTSKAFDSEAIDTHQTYSYKFAKAGTYTYFCEIHPYMHGTLVVTPAK
jgi:plastocyanin